MKAAYKHILVPVDFSRGSRLALDYAIGLATKLGASIRVLHVVEDPAIAGLFTEAYVDLALIRKERRCDARRRLNEMLNGLTGVPFTDEIVAGEAAKTIAGVAADVRADFIVMGTHGRTGIAHVLLGSVAEDVIRLACCPVMTVRDGLQATEAFAESIDERQVVPA